jgi:hypothetical protein
MQTKEVSARSTNRQLFIDDWDAGKVSDGARRMNEQMPGGPGQRVEITALKIDQSFQALAWLKRETKQGARGRQASR